MKNLIKTLENGGFYLKIDHLDQFLEKNSSSGGPPTGGHLGTVSMPPAARCAGAKIREYHVKTYVLFHLYVLFITDMLTTIKIRILITFIMIIDNNCDHNT